MEDIFKEHLDYCMVYIDDVLVASAAEGYHFKHTTAILREFQRHKITISPSKYELCRREIDFLGVHIKKGKITLQEHIVKKILEFPDIITCRKDLQSYLGILNCANEFIKDLAKYRTSLFTKLKKTEQTIPFTWDQRDIDIIKQIRELVKQFLL